VPGELRVLNATMTADAIEPELSRSDEHGRSSLDCSAKEKNRSLLSRR
jgi:hypothetical protein